MKNITAPIFFLFLTISLNAQQSESEFHKTIDKINTILKENPLAYYTDHKQNSAFIKKISANQQGIITFTDSIPAPESATNDSKPKLQPDCCPPKTIRTLNLFAVKKWDIYFQTAYIKNKNNQTYGRIIGLQKEDLYKLKEHFDKLKNLCRKEETTTK